MFENIKQFQEIRFSTCEGCLNNCCSNGHSIMTPLILEDIRSIYTYFPIYFAAIDRKIRLVMLLSGKNISCPYLKDQKCTIYDIRPSMCRLYPITPFYDEIFLDTSCKAVGEYGSMISAHGVIKDDFYNERLNDFALKFAATESFISKFSYSLEVVDEIQGISLFDYTGNKTNEILDMIRFSRK